MIRVALVQPPNSGNSIRGIGFYVDNLYRSISGLSDISISWVPFQPFFLQNRFDIIHFPYFDITFPTLSLFRSAKTVVTVHDLTPLKFPKHFPMGTRGKVVWPMQKALLSTVDAIIADSYASKADITAFAKIPESKIHVVYLSQGNKSHRVTDQAILQKVRTKYKLPAKFALYVGGVNWNKNLPTLIKACLKIKLPLVIVGKEALGKGADLSNIENAPLKEILELSKNKLIQRLGFVDTEDLIVIYNLANIYVLPSVYEGFGITILEAMAAGTPVVCGRNSSLTEIAGDAATYVDVQNVDALAKAIISVRKTGKEIAQAAKFTWQKTAEQTCELYKRVLDGQKG